MELKESPDGLKWFVSGLDVRHGVFTRAGGVSPAPFEGLNVGGTVGDDVANVRENHGRMYAALGVDGTRAVTTWQVHGVDVVAAHAPLPHRKWQARADAIMTNRPGLPLVMRFGDCTPILCHDPVRRVIGLAHAGWRGTADGMAGELIRAMQDCYGTRPADVQAVIGPCISQDHYQVGEEVVAAFEARYGHGSGLIRRDTADGTAYADLWAANELDLRAAGVRQTEVMRLCTYANPEWFYSHRAQRGRTGRFGVVMCL